MSQKLTFTELFSLFGRTPDQVRMVGSVDSEEYLTLLTYLVERSN